MSKQLLDYYKAIENSSEKMLQAAKVDDWDGVARFEGNCAVLIEQLRFEARQQELDAQARAEKSRIMLRILNNDAQIRYLAEPWLASAHTSLERAAPFLH
ncbi:MAG: flagellar protein FliT [Rhodoferax sp.]|nr:flagellar protein FliT [Rhodoferax sp.]MCF8208374.1 flagellar protein FliT [Rhodoferax sp.]